MGLCASGSDTGFSAPGSRKADQGGDPNLFGGTGRFVPQVFLRDETVGGAEEVWGVALTRLEASTMEIPFRVAASPAAAWKGMPPRRGVFAQEREGRAGWWGRPEN